MKRGLLATLLLWVGGCQCVTFKPDTSFLCEAGSCPSGFYCTADGYCDAVVVDGGPGGGAGGGGGGSGGAGGGTVVVLGPCVKSWCWEHPQPWGTASSLASVATTSANDTWVVGSNGFIFHWNGSKWQQSTSESRFDLNDVWVSPEGDVWAVGRSGAVVHLENGRFVERGRAMTDNLTAITGMNAQDFWTVGSNGRISRYQAGTWSDLAASPSSANYADLSVTDPSRVLVAGEALQHFEGGAMTRLGEPFSGLTSVWVNPGGEAWLSGSGGELVRSVGSVPDAGTGWTSVASGTTSPISGLWGTPGGDLFYGAADGVYLSSPTFSGKVSAQPNVSAVSGTDSSNVWASSFDGTVVRRSLTGGVFADQRQLVGATSLGFNSVALNTDGTAFAVGEDHVAVRRNSAGQWNTVSVEGASSGGDLWEVWSDKSDRAAAVGSDPSRLLVYDPGVGSFRKPLGFNPVSTLWTVWGSGDQLWAGGDNSYLIHFDGTLWAPVVGLPRVFVIEGIWGVSPSNFWVVGENGVILHWDGAAWAVERDNGGGDDLLGVGGQWPQSVYAVGENGLVFHRDPFDGGWAQEDTGTSFKFENVAVADGVTMVVASEGELLQRDDDGGWRRLGTTAKDGIFLRGLSGAAGKGFLCAGEKATLLKWVP